MTPIERRYRLLMRAFPRWYRRERGAELLTTLLDDAGPGQRRPTPAEALDLIRGGLRARFRPPRILGWIAVAVVSVYLGIAGVSAGVSLSSYPGPPPEADAIAAATVAMARTPQDVPGPPVRCDLTSCPDRSPLDHVVAYTTDSDHTDHTVVFFPTPWEETPEAVSGARERLRAAGWTVGPVRVQDGGYRSFEASRGGYNLLVHADPPTSYGTLPGGVDLSLSKAVPGNAVVLLIVGGIVGVLTGWQLTVWVLQLRRRHPLGRRLAVLAVSTPLLAVATLYTPVVANMGIYLATADEFEPRSVKMTLLIMPGEGFIWIVTAVAAASGLAVLALAALPGRGPGRQPNDGGVPA